METKSVPLLGPLPYIYHTYTIQRFMMVYGSGFGGMILDRQYFPLDGIIPGRTDIWTHSNGLNKNISQIEHFYT